MDTELTALILGIIFLATLTRATFGFGDSLLAMPLLALAVDLRLATPLVALVATTIAVLILSRSWRSVRLASAWRLILASALGVPLGLMLLGQAALDVPLKLTLAGVVIAFAAFKLLKPDALTLEDERWAWPFGFVAGVLGGAYNTNGPPVVVYGTLRRWPPETFRATLQGYFLPIGIVISIGHGLSGLWTPQVLTTYALSLPLIALAFLLGHALSERFDEARFARFIYALLIAMGLLLAAQTLPPIL